MTYEEFVIYILMVYAVFLFVVFYFLVVRNWGKIKIRVKTPMGEKNHYRKVEDDGKTIIMEKGSDRKKKPKWKFTFSNKSVNFTKYLLGLRERKTIDVFYHAPKAIEYEYDTKKAKTPRYDKKTSKEFIEMEGLKKRGELSKYPLPSLFWLMFLTNLLCLGGIFLIISRFGIF